MNFSSIAILRTTLVLVIAVSLAEQPACADNKQQATSYRINIRTCDEIWIVSSRNLDPCNFVPDQLCVQKLQNGQWQRKTVADLLDNHREQCDQPLLIYVHGSRLDFYWARRRGLETYQDLTVVQTAAPPMRYVIWAWPSEDHDRMVRNYPKILSRSIQEGNVLGWFLAVAEERHRIGVLSYSLGAQVLGSAFEVVHSRYGETSCCRSVGIGSVTSCVWPKTAQQASAAVAGMNRMLVIDNQQDQTVCSYKKWCQLRRSGPLGLELLAQYDLQGKLQKIDVTNLVGEAHQIHKYLSIECIARRVVDHLFDRGSASSAQLTEGDSVPAINLDVLEHCEPGNPASNPRRKLFSMK